MGNRGRLHDDRRQIVRDAGAAAWIICLLQFKDRHREVMAPRSYTELFFLDEATALAAGHRPCFECRRADAREFARLAGASTAKELDALLRPWRRPVGAGRPTWTVSSARELPAGAFIRVDDDDSWLVADGSVRRWSFTGYGPAHALPNGPVDVLTPKPTVHALQQGYVARVTEESRRLADPRGRVYRRKTELPREVSPWSVDSRPPEDPAASPGAGARS